MNVNGTVQISIEDFDHLRNMAEGFIKLINKLRGTVEVSYSEGEAKLNLNNLMPLLEEIISDDITSDYYLTRLPYEEAIVILKEYVDNDIPF